MNTGPIKGKFRNDQQQLSSWKDVGIKSITVHSRVTRLPDIHTWYTSLQIYTHGTHHFKYTHMGTHHNTSYTHTGRNTLYTYNIHQCNRTNIET